MLAHGQVATETALRSSQGFVANRQVDVADATFVVAYADPRGEQGAANAHTARHLKFVAAAVVTCGTNHGGVGGATQHNGVVSGHFGVRTNCGGEVQGVHTRRRAGIGTQKHVVAAGSEVPSAIP